MARLPRAFFARPSFDVAPDLLGRVLVRRVPTGEIVRARIVETEAYEPDDPASHSFRGPSRRNAAMFGRPGHLYVYFTYGMHWCMNVVTGPVGHGSAVLLRAGEPQAGHDAMTARRGGARTRDLCRGPARWTQAFSIDGRDDGVDLVRGTGVWLETGTPVPASRIARGPRVGIRDGVDRPWRFWETESAWVSPGPRTGPTRRGRGQAPRSR